MTIRTLYYLALSQLMMVALGDERYRCPSGSTRSGYIYEYDNKCYQFILEEKTWVDAKSFCYSNGGSLVNTDTQQKHDFVIGILTNQLAAAFARNGFWIGLHDTLFEAQFLWDQGPGQADLPAVWTNWAEGEPNDFAGQDCVYMRRSYDWKWVDVSCDGLVRTYAFACEYKMLPASTTPTASATSTSPNQTSSTEGAKTIDTSSAEFTIDTPDSASKAAEKIGELKPGGSKEKSGDKTSSSNVTDVDGSKMELAKSVEHKASSYTGRYVGLAVGLAIVVAIVLLLVLFLRMRRRKHESKLITIANPCYMNDIPRVADSSEEENVLNGYSVCGGQSQGNIYVGLKGERNPQINREGYICKENDRNLTVTPNFTFFKQNPLYDMTEGLLAKRQVQKQDAEKYGACSSSGSIDSAPIYAEIPEAQNSPFNYMSREDKSHKYDIPMCASRSSIETSANIYEEMPELQNPKITNPKDKSVASSLSKAVAVEYHVPKVVLKPVEH